MTQLSNVNKVDPHTGFWWTLLKAWSSLHLGPVADVWLRVQSSHLSVFLMLTLYVLVVCRLFKYCSYRECHNHAHTLRWSCELLLHTTPWGHARVSEQIDGLVPWADTWQHQGHRVTTDMLNVHFLTVQLLSGYLWCAQLPSSLLFEYVQRECSRNPVL